MKKIALQLSHLSGVKRQAYESRSIIVMFT